MDATKDLDISLETSGEKLIDLLNVRIKTLECENDILLVEESISKSRIAREEQLQQQLKDNIDALSAHHKYEINRVREDLERKLLVMTDENITLEETNRKLEAEIRQYSEQPVRNEGVIRNKCISGGIDNDDRIQFLCNRIKSLVEQLDSAKETSDNLTNSVDLLQMENGSYQREIVALRSALSDVQQNLNLADYQNPKSETDISLIDVSREKVQAASVKQNVNHGSISDVNKENCSQNLQKHVHNSNHLRDKDHNKNAISSNVVDISDPPCQNIRKSISSSNHVKPSINVIPCKSKDESPPISHSNKDNLSTNSKKPKRHYHHHRDRDRKKNCLSPKNVDRSRQSFKNIEKLRPVKKCENPLKQPDKGKSSDVAEFKASQYISIHPYDTGVLLGLKRCHVGVIQDLTGCLIELQPRIGRNRVGPVKVRVRPSRTGGNMKLAATLVKDFCARKDRVICFTSEDDIFDTLPIGSHSQKNPTVGSYYSMPCFLSTRKSKWS
eukprot:905219_1